MAWARVHLSPLWLCHLGKALYSLGLCFLSSSVRSLQGFWDAQRRVTSHQILLHHHWLQIHSIRQERWVGQASATCPIHQGSGGEGVLKFHEVSTSSKIRREFRIWAAKEMNKCPLRLANNPPQQLLLGKGNMQSRRVELKGSYSTRVCPT